MARATNDAEMNQELRLLDLYFYFLLLQKLQVMREYAVTDESLAQVTVSTACRSKGLKLPIVVLNGDLEDITDLLLTECECTDETNLLYVAVARTREALVLNGLLQMLMKNERDAVIETGDSAC